MVAIGLRNLYNMFTSSISDNSGGKGFGKTYFNNNSEEEGDTAQEISKLLKKYFILLDYFEPC